MSHPRRETARGVRRGIGAIAFLTIRGLLLWLLVPLAAVVWLLGGFRAGTIGQVIGWFDTNAGALITRTVVRPFGVPHPSWIAWTDLRAVEHRVDPFDPV